MTLWSTSSSRVVSFSILGLEDVDDNSVTADDSHPFGQHTGCVSFWGVC